ncbi:unnamed protein product [Orchesella dallaii]|uniref:Uncharacterized protein n=1 Tax=Orchesella dallaii TaxID=48710 RepID=A0ABP1R276_9HEXA
MYNLYVHLQSDSSPTYFPNNTITDFRNQLANPLDIDTGLYEVALVQCSYVYNPPQLKKGHEIAQVIVCSELEKITFDESLTTNFVNPSSLYQHSDFVADYVMDVDSYNRYKEIRGEDCINRAFAESIAQVASHLRQKDHILFTERTVDVFHVGGVNSIGDVLRACNQALIPFQSSMNTNGKQVFLQTIATNEFVLEIIPSNWLISYFGLREYRINPRKFIKNPTWTDIDESKFQQAAIQEKLSLFRVRYIEKEQNIGPIKFNMNETFEGKELSSELVEIKGYEYYRMLLKRQCGNPNSKERVRCWRTIYSVCTQEDVYDVEGLIRQWSIRHQIRRTNSSYAGSVRNVSASRHPNYKSKKS